MEGEGGEWGGHASGWLLEVLDSQSPTINPFTGRDLRPI